MDERRNICVFGLQLHSHVCEASIPVRDDSALVFRGVAVVGLRGDQRTKIDRRYAEEQKVARASLVDLLEEARVRGENGVVEGCIVEPPAVADVVDADEEGEEGGFRCPGGGGGVRAVDGEVLCLDLVFH